MNSAQAVSTQEVPAKPQGNTISLAGAPAANSSRSLSTPARSVRATIATPPISREEALRQAILRTG